MPDHLHTIWFVRLPMKQSIRQVAQGFWQATKKLGRAYSYISSLKHSTSLTGTATNENTASAIPSTFVTNKTQQSIRKGFKEKITMI